jgi:hypothetical protein
MVRYCLPAARADAVPTRSGRKTALPPPAATPSLSSTCPRSLACRPRAISPWHGTLLLWLLELKRQS